MNDPNVYEWLRAKLQEWAKANKDSKWLESLLILPDFLYLLTALTFDPKVPAKYKAMLATVIVYIYSPLDLIPEGFLGPAGFIDDVALAAYTINQILKEVDEGVVLKHWKGTGDVLQLVRHIVEVADQMMGSGLWEKIKKMAST